MEVSTESKPIIISRIYRDTHPNFSYFWYIRDTHHNNVVQIKRYLIPSDYYICMFVIDDFRLYFSKFGVSTLEEACSVSVRRFVEFGYRVITSEQYAKYELLR